MATNSTPAIRQTLYARCRVGQKASAPAATPAAIQHDLNTLHIILQSLENGSPHSVPVLLGLHFERGSPLRKQIAAALHTSEIRWLWQHSLEFQLFAQSHGVTSPDEAVSLAHTRNHPLLNAMREWRIAWVKTLIAQYSLGA